MNIKEKERKEEGRNRERENRANRDEDRISRLEVIRLERKEILWLISVLN